MSDSHFIFSGKKTSLSKFKHIIIFTLSFLVLFFVCSEVNAQYGYYDDPEARHSQQQSPGKWAFGGEFWASFGSITYIDIEPLVYYIGVPNLAVGAGPVYRYENWHHYNLKRDFWGGRVVTRYAIIPNVSDIVSIGNFGITALAEYQMLNIKPFEYDKNGNLVAGSQYYLIHNLLLGGGLIQPLGERGFFSIGIMFDVTGHMYSPYTNPIIKIGFGV